MTHWLVSFKGHLLILSADLDQHYSTEVAVDLQLHSSDNGKMSLRFGHGSTYVRRRGPGRFCATLSTKELESAKPQSESVCERGRKGRIQSL